MMDSQSFFKVYNASAGSGKTFTLVKEYLKIILTSDDYEFQKILAITFTNKAAAEMKQRVLNTLKDASVNTENPIIEAILSEEKLLREEVQQKSKRVLNNILHNYASFHIITIDSFTHKLVRTFSLDLGLPLDFEVEMDIEPLLEETIDLLIAKVGEDTELTKTLVQHTLNQVNDDKSWNINTSLIEVARLLLNEENELEISKLINTNLSDFSKLETKLRNYLKDTENAFKDVGQQAINLIDEYGIAHNSFSASTVPNYFKKFVSGWNLKEVEIARKSVQKCFDNDSFYAKTKPKDPIKLADREKIDQIKSELYPLYEISKKLYDNHFGSYFLTKRILKSLTPLAVLSYINKEFTNLKDENNIRLNAEFNRFVSTQIKDEPVPFIYERLGEKYQYFFIDEMQDTSALQWQNLIPLIHNSLSQNQGGLMLVGDAKQSIYRWRGGKASQFVALSDTKNQNDFFTEKTVMTLDTNYRSYSNIIDFNNTFFSFLATNLKDPAYQEIYAQEKHQKTNNKQGGFVHVEVHEREDDFDSYEHYATRIKNLINEVEQHGFDKGDICILTRKTKDGIAVADYLVSEGIEVISPDSLLLKNNATIIFLIALLRWIENPNDKEMLIEALYFLHTHLNKTEEKHNFFSQCISKNNTELFSYLEVDFSLTIFFSKSLYDGIEYLIRAFNLEPKIDVFAQAFLDFILTFQVQDSGGLQSFLNHWDLKKQRLKVEIAANKDAIQIMTIHKSKGLEFPVVIFPFDLNTEDINRETIWYNTEQNQLFEGFSSFQINASSKLALYGEQGENYLNETTKETQLDNFNLLYVALTRAEEQLYVLSDTKNTKTSTNKNYSDYFKQFIEIYGDNNCYTKGDPKRLSTQKESSDPFTLNMFESIDKEENQIFVVQNNEDFNEARQYGNILHKAFEKIISHDDIEKAFIFIDQQGLSEELTDTAKQTVTNVVNHPELKLFYEKNTTAYNERSFVTKSGQINIIDRVIFNDNKATIIDYKTGKHNKSHQLQIENYSYILKDLGYEIDHLILVYCNKTTELVKI